MSTKSNNVKHKGLNSPESCEKTIQNSGIFGSKSKVLFLQKNCPQTTHCDKNKIDITQKHRIPKQKLKGKTLQCSKDRKQRLKRNKSHYEIIKSKTSITGVN